MFVLLEEYVKILLARGMLKPKYHQHTVLRLRPEEGIWL